MGQIRAQLLVCIATSAIPDPSCFCNLHSSLRQCQILNPLSEARNQTHILTHYVRFLTHCATMGTPFILFYFILFYFILFYFILFFFILFYFILFYFILFYFISLILRLLLEPETLKHLISPFPLK